MLGRNEVESYFFPPLDLGNASFVDSDLNRTKTDLLDGPEDFLNDLAELLFFFFL